MNLILNSDNGRFQSRQCHLHNHAHIREINIYYVEIVTDLYNWNKTQNAWNKTQIHGTKTSFFVCFHQINVLLRIRRFIIKLDLFVS